jgi:hypothetical protein
MLAVVISRSNLATVIKDREFGRLIGTKKFWLIVEFIRHIVVILAKQHGSGNV